MPKHAPTFKHLIASSSSNQRVKEKRERTVIELLANSRNATTHAVTTDSVPGIGSASGSSSAPHRDVPPHLPQVWTTNPGAPTLVDIENGQVHPAEILRREHVAYRAAARSVAGPAPPRSWRRTIASSTAGEEETHASTETARRKRDNVTVGDLVAASALLSCSRLHASKSTTGPPRLVDYCIRLVLALLHDDSVLEEGEQSGSCATTFADAVLDSARALDAHIRADMIQTCSILPPGDGLRLADAHLRALLGFGAVSPSRKDTSWEESDVDDTTHLLTHLPLTAHTAPLPILRDLPRFSGLALTSLDLAYSTLPADLERVVAVLPTGLRELGLVGVSVGKGGSEDDWRRGLNSLGRKLIVLHTLDLSDFPFPITPALLSPLLQPPISHLPSLRALGLRGALRENSETTPVVSPRSLLDVIRGEGRQRWVDVVFE